MKWCFDVECSGLWGRAEGGVNFDVNFSIDGGSGGKKRPHLELRPILA